MELSAYPRHRKRCLNGFRAPFTLFNANGRLGTLAIYEQSLAVSQAQSNSPQMLIAESPASRVGLLNDLADKICQEAGGNSSSNPASGAALGAALTLTQARRAAENVMANSYRQEAKPHLVNVSRVDAWSDGRQSEVHDRRAYIRRNWLEQIIEIHSAKGERISFAYWPNEALSSFTIFSSHGEIEITGIVEGERVIVKDGAGNLILIGRSMELFQTGCLIINQSDERVLGIDLVRALYIEKQMGEWNTGMMYCLKGMFALDGFRMCTRFLALPSGATDGASSRQLLVRFYGRDGSIVSFDSQEKLRLFEPSQWQPAGSRSVKSNFLSEGGQQTAWHSVNVCARADWDYFHEFIVED